MKYILLDLEWNNAYFPKIRGWVNEIVEFGAVKLDENFREIDRFNMIVRSSLTKRLSGRFKELTGMSNETMLNGVKFSEALESYKKWAGEDSLTLTWSDTDLYVLYDNCLYFTNSPENAKIGLYTDLQKYFHFELAAMGKTEKNQISLSNAAILFDIDTNDQTLHHAVDDSAISAAILRKCYKPEHFEQFIFNTNATGFYERLRFKSYFIRNLQDENIDKSQLFIRCPECNCRAKRITKYKFNNRWFIAGFFCKDCNLKFKGLISFRKLYDRVEVKKKTRPFEEAAKLKIKEKTTTT